MSKRSGEGLGEGIGVVECVVGSHYPVAFFSIVTKCQQCDDRASTVLVIHTGPSHRDVAAVYLCSGCAQATLRALRRRDGEHVAEA